jgi:hypothetical protein
MSQTIESVIGHLRNPFIIVEDGSSQTSRSNHGRVGFLFERMFGISPNSDRRPDFGTYELKTTQKGKKISIGTMTDSEFLRIKTEPDHVFDNSDPYKKIKNTLLIIYTKIRDYPEPCYYMNGWQLVNLENMSDRAKTILQSDYKKICEIIKYHCTSRDDVTDYLQSYGSVSGQYLTLVYKGQGAGGYNYPAWAFQGSFMKLITNA